VLINQPQDQLLQRIKEFGATAMESRQIARRLKELLHPRFFDLRRDHASRLNHMARAERYALVDQRFETFVEEYVEMTNVARTARVQYETHMMLLQARQSLRGFRSYGSR
jgi:hypothetical protein